MSCCRFSTYIFFNLWNKRQNCFHFLKREIRKVFKCTCCHYLFLRFGEIKNINFENVLYSYFCLQFMITNWNMYKPLIYIANYFCLWFELIDYWKWSNCLKAVATPLWISNVSWINITWIEYIEFNRVQITKKLTHLSIIVPKNVSVSHGASLDDTGEIDGAASLNKQLLVAQNGGSWFWKIVNVSTGYSNWKSIQNKWQQH